MKNNQKCAIIGCGNVGATTAYTLMQSGLVSELVLIDVNKKKAEGEDVMELCLIEKDEENKDKKEQEARLVANRIQRLVGTYEVSDGAGGLRKAGYGDIVILLRNVKGWDEAFSNVFEEMRRYFYSDL